MSRVKQPGWCSVADWIVHTTEANDFTLLLSAAHCSTSPRG
ncbi:hypothetical protein [Serratia oryzae]|nr:hypothetical protein [Serratia oryzae]